MTARVKNRLDQLIAYVWEHGPITRREISAALKINMPAVSKVTAQLLEEQRLVEKGREDSTGGRKAQLLDIPADAGAIVAVSFSSQGLVSGLSNMKGSLTNRQSAPFDRQMTAEETHEAIENLIQQQIDDAAAKSQAPVLGLGIVLSGIVDESEGVSVVFPRMENWRNVPLRRMLAERIQLPIAMGNRICSITQAEKICGKHQHYNNFLYANLGPGIGLGICIDGQVYRGVHYSAGELGHTTVVENGKLCYCGNYGCLETVASDEALIAEAQKGLGSGVESRITEFAGTSELLAAGKERAANAIFRAAEAGDRFAGQLVNIIGQALGTALANVINLFGPECLILGGTMSSPSLIKVIARTLKHRTLERLEHNLELVSGSFGGDEGLKGAAIMALWRHFHQYEQ